MRLLLFAGFSTTLYPSPDRVKRFFLKGSQGVVPSLWHLEMSNGLAVAEPRSSLTSADINQAMIDLEQIVAQAVDTDATVVPFGNPCFTTSRLIPPSASPGFVQPGCTIELLPLSKFIIALEPWLGGSCRRMGTSYVPFRFPCEKARLSA